MAVLPPNPGFECDLCGAPMKLREQLTGARVLQSGCECRAFQVFTAKIATAYKRHEDTGLWVEVGHENDVPRGIINDDWKRK
jgi:hypothetical protein